MINFLVLIVFFSDIKNKRYIFCFLIALFRKFKKTDRNFIFSCFFSAFQKRPIEFLFLVFFFGIPKKTDRIFFLFFFFRKSCLQSEFSSVLFISIQNIRTTTENAKKVGLSVFHRA